MHVNFHILHWISTHSSCSSKMCLFCVFSTPAGKRYQQLLLQVEKLQEENFKIDAGKCRNRMFTLH